MGMASGILSFLAHRRREISCSRKKRWVPFVDSQCVRLPAKHSAVMNLFISVYNGLLSACVSLTTAPKGKFLMAQQKSLEKTPLLAGLSQEETFASSYHPWHVSAMLAVDQYCPKVQTDEPMSARRTFSSGIVETWEVREGNALTGGPAGWLSE